VKDQTVPKVNVLQDVQISSSGTTSVIPLARLPPVITMVVTVKDNVTLDVQTTGLVMVSVTTPVMLKNVATTKEIVISSEMMDQALTAQKKGTAHQDVQNSGSVMAFVTPHA